MRKRTMVILTTLVLVLVGGVDKGFCQEQIVLNGSFPPVAFDFSTFMALSNSPRGFVDLAALRERCNTIQVKLVSWLNNPGGGTVFLELVYQDDSAATVPIVDISSTSPVAVKVQSDWIDLLDRVPAARTESLGHVYAVGRVDSGQGESHGPTIIFRCVHAKN
jgi:hypothetical protein